MSLIFKRFIQQIKLDHLRTVFVKINDYRIKTVDNIIKGEIQKENVDIANEPEAKTADNNERKIKLFRPFCGNSDIA